MNNTLSEAITIDRNINWLFDFTQNLSERTKWDKQTKQVAFCDGFERLEKGARVYTESVEGIRMDTEYLTFEKPNEISIKMLNKSRLFKSFIGTWNYLPVENEKTTLQITYQFTLRFPYTLLAGTVNRKIKNNLSKKLQYLKLYLTDVHAPVGSKVPTPTKEQ